MMLARREDVMNRVRDEILAAHRTSLVPSKVSEGMNKQMNE